jgi:predicted GIY-YIG superfamily endonuclease
MNTKDKHYVYIWKGLYKNPKKSKYYRYRGYTTNLEKRLEEHKNNKQYLYNLQYIWIHEFKTKQSALKFEKFLKSYNGYIWSNININDYNYEDKKYDNELIEDINKKVDWYLTNWSINYISLYKHDNKYELINGKFIIKL